MNKQPANDKYILDGKIFALLSYLSILCIIPLILKRDNKFVLEHGKQGLVIFVITVSCFILHIVLGPWFLKLSILICGLYSMFGIFKVLQGQYVNLFLISGIAKKITL